MGRPFEIELSELPSTYRWAIAANVQRLATAVRRSCSLPLLAVGSGGSLTVADFAAHLHTELTGLPAFAQTPLQTVSSQLNLRNCAVLMVTAGGSNPDVVGSFERIAKHEPKHLSVICLSTGTPMSRRAVAFPFVDFVELDPPVAKDGFLATNSLIAAVVLLARAYSQANGIQLDLPFTWEDLVAFNDFSRLHRDLLPLWEKETLVVLHGPDTRAAALDIESKFTEAALRNVWTADYRHFAHGRHHWLAKRAFTTAVLAFITPAHKEIGEKTVDLIPTQIPVVRHHIPFKGIVGVISALARVMFITKSAGDAAGIDPGRPGVPAFGRRIYRLNAFPSTHKVVTLEDVAVERKTGLPVTVLSRNGILDFWRDAYKVFVTKIAKTSFAAVVLDYDGTLCGEADRFGGLTAEIAKQLERLSGAGILLGIATGRGKSVREALRTALPETCWDKIIVGYYNGGDVGFLHDDSRPDGSPQAGEPLRPLAEALISHPLLNRLAAFEFRVPQIKVEVNPGHETELVWQLLQQVVHTVGLCGVSLLRSTHSMDILAPGVDKRTVVRRAATVTGKSESAILCIGDRGRYPGNDYLLLTAPYSLSVDETGADPTTCWNVAPVGYRGVDACLAYLRRLKTSKRGTVRFMPSA